MLAQLEIERLNMINMTKLARRSTVISARENLTYYHVPLRLASKQLMAINTELNSRFQL